MTTKNRLSREQLIGDPSYSPRLSTKATANIPRVEGKMTEDPGHGLAAEALQRELRDLLCLAVVCDHLRWVVTAPRQLSSPNG